MQSRSFRQRERHKLYLRSAHNPKLQLRLLNDGMHEALAFEKAALKRGVGMRPYPTDY
jgi:hypothetical protein